MGKKVIFPIVIITLILGVFISMFIKENTSFNVKKNEVVAMKYYVNKERSESYHTVPKALEKESIEAVVNVLNNGDIKEKMDFAPIAHSDRKLYIFLDNNDVIVINNSIDEEKYIVEYPNNSILGSSCKSKYVVINSERLKNVFLNIENSFIDVNDFEQRMKV